MEQQAELVSHLLAAYKSPPYCVNCGSWLVIFTLWYILEPHFSYPPALLRMITKVKLSQWGHRGAVAFISSSVATYNCQGHVVSVGHMMQVAAVALGAWLVANNASPLQRLWVAPPLVFGLGFIDSSIQGLCTESWVSIVFFCLLPQLCGSFLCNVVHGACCVALGITIPLTLPCHVHLCTAEQMLKHLGAASLQLQLSSSRLYCIPMFEIQTSKEIGAAV